MHQTATRAPLGGLDDLIRDGLEALDITQAEHERVVRRYGELGEVLDEHWASTHGQNAVFPQGSFSLGTVVRNVNRNDDIDIDVVAKRDTLKTSISQEELKNEVGAAVWAYARRPGSGFPDVEESSRCWTLTWPEMHMDVLPAIPNLVDGGDNLYITDKDVRRWLPSNPAGYAAWFRSRMEPILFADRAAEAKRLEIEDVPEWRRRTVLQRTVQALKRHRDIYFGARDQDRPASIVITTLAAHAYAGGSDLYETLRQVTRDLADYLEQVDGAWVLRNPAQPEESFTDAWAADPTKASHFFEWRAAAQGAFAEIEVKSGLHETLPLLEATFGSRFARGAERGLANSITSAREGKALRLHAGGALGAGATGPALVVSHPVRSHAFAGGSR